MSKNKAPTAATHDDPVELSNVIPDDAHDGDTEFSQVQALQALCDDRASKIKQLEKERDDLVRDLEQANGGSHDLATQQVEGNGSRIQVASIDLLSAPEHSLVLRCLGDEEDLKALKRGLEAAIRKLSKDNDNVSFDGGRMPGEVRAVLESMPVA